MKLIDIKRLEAEREEANDRMAGLVAAIGCAAGTVLIILALRPWL